MDRSVIVKNNQEVIDVYGGMEISGGCSYEIDSDAALSNMQNDSHLHEDILSSPARALIGNGETYFNDGLAAQRWLMGSWPQDSDGRPYYRQVITQPNWLYSPHSLDFYTAKLGSLYNREHDGAGIDDGTDSGDAELLFYDVSGNCMVQGESETDPDYQIRLTAGCIKTIMSWEKPTSFDVVGAYLNIQDNPAERAYLWVVAAPDVPKEWGGCKPFMGRGMNLQMMKAKDNHLFDAKTVSRINYDPNYHSGKIHIIVKHALGVQLGIQMVFIVYEA